MFQREAVIAIGPSVRERVSATIWKIQAYGLVLITFLSFFPRLFHREEYLFLVLLLVALVTAWREGRTLWVRTPIDVPLLLFVGWVLLTIPFATDLAYSFAEWRKLVTQVLVFYWALLVLRSQNDQTMRRCILAALILGTFLICAYAITDFVARGGTWRDRDVRARAPYSDYNWLSTYMVMAIPMLVSAGIAFEKRWQRFACWGVLGLALVTQGFSYTRAGWLGTAVQGVCFGLVTRRRRIVVGVILLCLALVLGILALSGSGYQQQTFASNTFYYRLATWGLITEEIIAHPLFGVGYGNLTYMMRFGDFPESHDAGGAHNLFLMVAMGSGVPALIFLAWVFVGAFLILLRRAKETGEPFGYALMLGIAFMIVGFGVRNLFDYMFAGSLAFLFWILLAAGLGKVGKILP